MRHPPIALLVALAACQAAPVPDPAGSAASGRGSGPAVLADLPVSRAPYRSVEVDWKERLAQPYAFLEERGSYTGIGRLLERVWRELDGRGIAPSGPPFALFFDDPGRTPAAELRMRACFPVSSPDGLSEPLGHAVLESTTVVYAFVGGPYPDVPRAYPALFAYLRRMNWVESGPIREVYLVNPAEVESFDELVCEVQIPAANAR